MLAFPGPVVNQGWWGQVIKCWKVKLLSQWRTHLKEKQQTQPAPHLQPSVFHMGGY